MDKQWLERRIAARRNLPTKVANGGKASHEGISAMIQAGCAVVALALAIFAYSSWKNQEAAKRQADVAMEILRNVHATSQCLRRDLSILAKPLPTSGEIERIARVGLDAINRCSDDLARLSANALIARTLLDPATAAGLSRLDSWAAGRRRSLEMLDKLATFPMPKSVTETPTSASEKLDAIRSEIALFALRNLGARRLDDMWFRDTSGEGKFRLKKDDIERAPDGKPITPAREVLDEYVAGIEALLAKYIHFR